MTLDLIPDTERLLHGYLTSQPDVDALSTRFVGRTPKDTSGTWTRVTLLDARRLEGHLEHHISSLVQLDVYAGSQETVWLHARTIRAALAALEGTTTDDVTVTSVTPIGMARIPDSDFQPARERVILTVEIVAHPA